jgi:hypothetical protein
MQRLEAKNRPERPQGSRLRPGLHCEAVKRLYSAWRLCAFSRDDGGSYRLLAAMS